MSVPLAYIGVILIWTSTPLAIQWSGEGHGFLFGVASRMTLGTLVALMAAALLGHGMRWGRAARRAYLVAGLGIYGAMLATYWAAQYIPSGWVSVLFGLTPVITGLLARYWLKTERLGAHRLAGMGLGLLGLTVMFAEGARLGPHAVAGVLGIIAAATIQSTSAVGLKRLQTKLPALVLVAGGLLVATPLFLLTWYLADGAWPYALPARALRAIVYLGVAGSVLGFSMYFYVLQRVEATRVALITLVTPPSALLLGHVVNHEPLAPQVLLGVGCILGGLALFELGDRLRPRRLASPHASAG